MDGNVKAITLQGINHHLDKISVEDGMCEDLVNLRFKDGSWRTTGDGKIINEDDKIEYSQVFIHTNVYRHVLGVKDGKLWWFGNLIPKSDSDSVQKELYEFELLDDAVELMNVRGEVFLEGNGHLLVYIDKYVIDGAYDSNFYYFIFKKGDGVYKQLSVDQNGARNERKLFPYDIMHFNTIDIDDSAHTIEEESSPITLLDESEKRNLFTRPFLICASIRMYDGSYIMASNPVLVWPRQLTSDMTQILDRIVTSTNNKTFPNSVLRYDINNITRIDNNGLDESGVELSKIKDENIVCASVCDLAVNAKQNVPYKNGIFVHGNSSKYFEAFVSPYLRIFGSKFRVVGSELSLSINDVEMISNNKDVFDSICLFMTPQINVHYLPTDTSKMRFFDLVAERIKKTGSYNGQTITTKDGVNYINDQPVELASTYNLPSTIPLRQHKCIIEDLMGSQFYLLKTISVESLTSGTIKVDLEDSIDSGVLNRLKTSEVLPANSFSRSSAIPIVASSYNGRLHLANYKTLQFHGYPIDCFGLNNHSINTDEEGYFNGVIKGCISNHDELHTIYRSKFDMSSIDRQTLTNKSIPSAIAIVELETNDGTKQVVSRYIDTFVHSRKDGDHPSFIEDLGPLLTFPDSRAKKMTIMIVKSIVNNVCTVYKKVFNLKPHLYYNLAYYMDDKLLPIKISAFDTYSFTINN